MHRFVMIFGLILTAITAMAETRVRIVGLVNETEDGVLNLMSGRLEHIVTSRASPSRADDAAFLVRQVLRKDGYAAAQVDWRIASPSEIVLTVSEGGRLSLGTVTVNGVPAREASKLARLYARPATKGLPILSRTPPFREEDVASGLSFVRQELNAQGYWNAEASIANRTTDPATGVTNLVIDVDQGPRFRIAEAKVASPDGRGISETRLAAKPFISRTATTGNLNAMRLAVEQVFVSNGYPDAKVSMARTLEAPRFIPDFYIDLGRRVRLNKIHIEGLVRTNPKRIEARMRRLEGDWYDEAAMNKRIRGFLSIGAFSSARVETEDVGEDRIDATLHFREARAPEITIAAGGDS
jgi:outer membrane protein insertion porin family